MSMLIAMFYVIIAVLYIATFMPIVEFINGGIYCTAYNVFLNDNRGKNG